MERFDLEKRIREWLDGIKRRGGLLSTDAAELEDHLRSEVSALERTGLSTEEALLVGLHRIGNGGALSGEFRKVNGRFLWKQLSIGDSPSGRTGTRALVTVIVLSLAAGTLARVPAMLGLKLFGGDEIARITYLRNLALFFMPLVAAYFAAFGETGWRKGLAARDVVVIALTALSAIPVNLFPIVSPFQTSIMTGLHLPALLWLAVGITFCGKAWRDSACRLDFIRYTGEVAIYTVLILLGGGVLTALTLLIFQAIGIDVRVFYESTIAVYGAAAAPIVAVALVDAKKGVIENIAPVLARIFSPLFLIAILSYLCVMPALGKSPYTNRDTLVIFDGMLLVVIALAVYTISSRENHLPAGPFDWITLALIVAALVADCIALSAIVFRLAEYGITANKIVVLGDNVLFFGNLAGLAVFLARFLAARRAPFPASPEKTSEPSPRRGSFHAVVHFQTAYLGVYAVWTAFVSFVLPPLFSFR